MEDHSLTLRNLLQRCNYKTVFNFLYKKYHKHRTDEEITSIALAYRKVWEDLLSLPVHIDNDLRIGISEVSDDLAEDSQKTFINVALYYLSGKESPCLDIMLEEELIDLKITNNTSLDDCVVVAYILWEITFWNFYIKNQQS